MSARCLLYYIADRTAFAQNEDESARRRRLLEKIAEAARAGVDYIQLREKDLPTRELETLAREAVHIIRENAPSTQGKQLATDHWPPTTALLINSRTDVALAVGADGVHLRSDDISPQDVSEIWRKAHAGTATPGCPAVRSTAADLEISPVLPLVGVSCHSPADVARAAANGATFAVFGPIFEKKDAPDVRPTGLDRLREACKTNISVLALGGITLSNARSCLEAGAAGIAAIRLFQENNVEEVVQQLRSTRPGRDD